MEEVNKNCGIYKITSPTGKVYIGQAVDIKKRWTRYKNPNQTKAQVKIHRSLEKYGVEAHQFDIIEYCEPDQLNCSERFWQDEFNVLGENGLNCMLQKCGEKKYVPSEETKKKQSLAKLGDKNHNYGKKQSEETIIKRTLRYKTERHPTYGKPLPDEQYKELIERLSNYRRGSHPNARKVIDTATGMIFGCKRDAAEFLGMNETTLGDQLLGKYKNKTTLKYLEDEL